RLPGKCTTTSTTNQERRLPAQRNKDLQRETNMTKPLNVGMIGYGFMGRAHSNAYRKVNNFFDLEYRPVLKAACARSTDKVKPFAMTRPEGAKMVEAVEKANVPNMVWYNYRRVPAVTLAKKLVDEGKLGRIFHYRAKFLQDWTISADLPQGGTGLWRLDVAAAGSGVTGDLLAHCIDTALWHNGNIATVNAMTETFIKERKHNPQGKVEKVGI